MAGPVSLELDPIFLKGLSYLHSKSKDSAEKLKALLDESLARGSDSSYRSLQKVSYSLFSSFSVSLVCNLFIQTLTILHHCCLFSGYRGVQGVCIQTELK